MTWSEITLELIRAARQEDLGESGDLTAEIVRDPHEEITARVVTRAGGVICGLALGPLVANEFGAWLGAMPSLTPARRASGAAFADGDRVGPGETVAELRGPRRAVLIVERTLLNFLCRMSGVASLTRRYVDAARAANPAVKILDTRKTLPAWREIDKYAVRCGGGANHRFGLFDAVLVKDNHRAGIAIENLATELAAMLSRIATVAGAQRRAPAFIEVEVDSLEQMRAVCTVAGVQMILLDNFSVPQLAEAVKLRDALGLRGRIELEASGGVNLESISAIAATGVDRISVGAITHSAGALDLGLDFDSNA